MQYDAGRVDDVPKAGIAARRQDFSSGDGNRVGRERTVVDRLPRSRALADRVELRPNRIAERIAGVAALQLTSALTGKNLVHRWEAGKHARDLSHDGQSCPVPGGRTSPLGQPMRRLTPVARLCDHRPVMLRNKATAIVRRLQDAGHEAVFAGGCVRDKLLGIAPKDYDIATSATPDEVEALFERTLAVGRKFGIQIVQHEGHDFEVATFRKDGSYVDGRRPESVEFTSSIEDSARRDFTINALFEDPIADAVIDHHGGRADLESGIVRAVGDAAARFAEDRLRLIRAIRFAARFDFVIEPGTAAAITAAAAAINDVSAERLGDELTKILTQGNVRRAFTLMDETGLLGELLPEIAAMKGIEQSPDYHPEGDVFVHTLLCLHQLGHDCSPTLAYGVLFHDIAKPTTAELRGDKHTFYGHTNLGADMAEEVCRRLRLSNATIERVRFLVEQHLRHTDAAGMKTSTLKRFLRQEGIEELLELTRIDAVSSNGDLRHYEYCRQQLEELPEDVVRPARLVTGRDLIAMGMKPGPDFSRILDEIEDAQLEGRVTTREEALAYLREIGNRGG